MSNLVAVSGTAMCTMGTAPAPIKVTSQQKVLTEGKPAATIQDAQPMANIGPFGMCTSLANPQVAAATAAALGVLTPQPCIPAPAGTWIPTKPKILVGGKPCLSNDCKLVCAYAGQVSITVPGQVKVTAQ
ncbi:MAG: DUF4280 domain-containing protein [Butyrivibrio sp.]|uniref:DUF4280 domain-containing protein n=1 Tax=Butyrivibrio sp. FCS014 TaxID=1408304 RepID=UPI000463114D|nr:DUF4280 domain-containing protein [Butyrivibrio sp. FCS014]MCR5155840.1 DUF4280 domain-containing protein [Butyrivibrio sp.]